MLFCTALNVVRAQILCITWVASFSQVDIMGKKADKKILTDVVSVGAEEIHSRIIGVCILHRCGESFK